MRLILTIVLASSFLYSSASQTATIFNDQAAFNATVGSSLVVFDFDSVATEISAFSNGATFADNQLTIDSLTLTTDINLPTGTGPSGLFGTFLLKETSSSFFGVFASPGGDGAGGEPADDDDFQITLSSPVTAFGMWILDNNPESGESISIFGSSGQIASIALPGSSLGSGGNGFIGFIIEPGEEFITSVVVEESSLLNDDIAFDQISFAPVPIPAAFWLFGSGLLGLIGVARRKKS